MKLLLSGQPGSGKTTLLHGFADSIPNKQGFITREVRRHGERVGFELVSSTGRVVRLASIHFVGERRVSKYGVDVKQFDAFLTGLPSIKRQSCIIRRRNRSNAAFF